VRQVSSAGEAGSRTLVRGLGILRLFDPPQVVLSQTQIANGVDLPLATVGRLCRSLVNVGFLELESGSRRLRLGPEVRRLAGTEPQGTTEDARRWMRLLNEHFDEEVNLATLDGTHALYLDSMSSTRRLGVRTDIGSRAPAHCTAVGKMLLAQLDDRIVLDRLGRGPYEERTDKTISRWQRMREELACIRRTGLSRSFEEFETGLAGFAVALGQRSGGVELALSVAVPLARLNPERVTAIESALLSGPYSYRSEADDIVG
jgi:DNA-binding IclR family transcriptional regulator